MDGVELAGLAPAVAEAGQDLERLAQHDVDLLVRAIHQVHVLLLRVLRKGDVPRGAIAERVLRNERFLNERPVWFEYLYPVIDAVASSAQWTGLRNCCAGGASAR